MLKRLAFALVLAIAALGIVFVGLDVIDIAEDFRIHLPIAALNTVFISGTALAVSYLAARRFAATGSRQMLWLGCGSLALGAGTLLRAWLPGQEMKTAITVNEGCALFASALHLIGTLGRGEAQTPWSAFPRKIDAVPLFYIGTLAVVALVVLAGFNSAVASFYVPADGSTLCRDILRGVTGLVFSVSSVVCLGVYLRSRSDFCYWYSLSLALLALGVVFSTQGPLESRIGWLGRVSLYAGGAYLLAAVVGWHRRATAHLGG